MEMNEINAGNDQAIATVSLSVLPIGAAASIVGIAEECQGAERRRLLDLGFVPGTIIVGELISPGGDPTAYLIRGTLIALRRAQARWIQVIPVQKKNETKSKMKSETKG